MRMIDRAVAHFKGLARLSIDISEWGEDGAPATIYWQPLTMADVQKIYIADEDQASRLIRAIILKAEDAEGEKLFTLEDKIKLQRSVLNHAIVNLGNAILTRTPIEDARGN